MYQSGIELGDAQASGISLDTWARAGLGRVPAEVIEAELKRPGGDVQRTAQVLGAEGARLLHAGQADRAVAVFEQAVGLIQSAGVRNAWVSPVFPWLATALRTQAEQTRDVTPGKRSGLLARAWSAALRAVRVARKFRNDLPHALREAALISALRGRRRRWPTALRRSWRPDGASPRRCPAMPSSPPSVRRRCACFAASAA